jgi:hypothetical protein
MPVFSLTVADFLNAPSIEAIDLSAYVGQADNVINITASDDFAVAGVSVTLRNESGSVIEGGAAIETVPGSGRWTYTATASVPPSSTVNVQVVATDRPGGTAVQTASKSV